MPLQIHGQNVTDTIINVKLKKKQLTDNRTQKQYFFQNDNAKITEISQNDSVLSLSYFFDSLGVRFMVYFNSDGKINEVFWLDNNNLRTKTHTIYYPNGILKQVGFYKYGIEDSVWTYWHDNGQIYKIEEYNENFKRYEKPLIEHHTYKKTHNGEVFWQFAEKLYTPLNGKYLEYYKNGDMKIKGQYVDGDKDGIWYYYFEQDILEKKEIWDKGVLIETIHY
ncbi:MAG: hypothetical protein GX638_13785 [Crenarchaeota archaeon]|nr:hypothetical protein [Thermoproteota archaeon]